MGKLFKKYWWIIIPIFIIPIFMWIFLFIFFKEAIKNDIVTLVSATLTYYATVILALVTVLQNEKLTEISERSSEIEEIRLRNEYHPLFEIKGIFHSDEKTPYKFEKIYKNNFGPIYQSQIDDKETPVIAIENIGNAAAYSVQTYERGVVNCKTADSMFDYKPTNYAQIPVNESIILNAPFEEEAFFAINYTLSYKNKYNHHFHHELFIAMIAEPNGEKSVQVGLKPQEEGNADLSPTDIKQLSFTEP